MSDIWKDPSVKAALKEGRSADDIAVLECSKCGEVGYYNEGSHFHCRKCKVTYYVCGDEEEPPCDGRLWMYGTDVMTLSDTVDSGWNGGYP